MIRYQVSLTDAVLPGHDEVRLRTAHGSRHFCRGLVDPEQERLTHYMRLSEPEAKELRDAGYEVMAPAPEQTAAVEAKKRTKKKATKK